MLLADPRWDLSDAASLFSCTFILERVYLCVVCLNGARCVSEGSLLLFLTQQL